MPEKSNSKLSGKIVEWDDSKGYGFIQAGRGRLFLHRRDFTERHKRPAVGDVISYTMGSDLKGRPCAINATHLNDGGTITWMVVLLLSALLILPAVSLQLTALLGGWPGAFLAQRQFRHKVSKPGFQFVFWLIVFGYQFAAFDSLQNWQFSKQAWNHLHKTEMRRR